jgi:ABC-2 type transport system ATP-binding protein
MCALDPIIRERLLTILMYLLRDTGCTVLISSHILTDIEKIVNWVLCLDRGRLVENSSFDGLRECFAEWTLTAPEGGLADRFSEPFVLEASGGGRQARLKVRCGDPDAARRFAAAHGAQVTVRPLNLEEIFPLLVGRGDRS